MPFLPSIEEKNYLTSHLNEETSSQISSWSESPLPCKVSESLLGTREIRNEETGKRNLPIQSFKRCLARSLLLKSKLRCLLVY